MNISLKDLWDFVGRADTIEKIGIAQRFIAKLEWLSIEDFDALMDALAYQSREIYAANRYC